MKFKDLMNKYITVLLVLKNIILTIQQQTCTLPDGKRQSTCIRFQYCNELSDIYKQHNGNPPQDVIQFLNAHACGNKLYCCPDNAVFISLPPTTTSKTVERNNLQNLPERPADLSAIRRHKNFDLINEPTCGSSTEFRLTGGEDANLKEFPWAVLLGYQLLDSLAWQCGGSLISRRFVLTAAHCLTKDLKIVRLGEHTISTPNDCDAFNVCADPVQDIKIERLIKHPKYFPQNRREKNKNDIALLKLESPADITKNNVRTICLPTNEDTDIDQIKLLKRMFIITGWGKIGAGDPADVLQKAYVPYVENTECENVFAPHPDVRIYHTYICAGGDSLVNKTDTCKGDSGGGISTFALTNGQPKMTLYGVVSGGIKCEYVDLKYPGIYTNIKYYLDWILDNMS